MDKHQPIILGAIGSFGFCLYIISLNLFVDDFIGFLLQVIIICGGVSFTVFALFFKYELEGKELSRKDVVFSIVVAFAMGGFMSVMRLNEEPFSILTLASICIMGFVLMMGMSIIFREKGKTVKIE